MIFIPLAAAPQGLNVWSLVWEAGPMGKFVLLLLVGFSVISWGIVAERWRRFRRAEAETDKFLDRFHKGGGLAAIQDETSTLKWSPVAEVYRAGFREISLNPVGEGAVRGEALEAVDRMLRKSSGVQLTELERSLGFLATTASASPFIGLFGTVWGIMNAFRSIGVQGTASIAAYAPGIAEALVATAAGLIAAVPAVIAYNHFLARLNSMESLIEEFRADLLHRLQGRRV
jgi:biopolymer transport protein TolQ